MSDSKWSVPESTVYERIRELLDSDERTVLAPVIDVEGSAYRRPGAKMLVTPDGDGLGSVTAGCLEDDIKHLTGNVLATGEPRIITYDMMEDDDVWSLGVDCNGVIDVLLEPLTEAYRPALDVLEAGDSLGLVTVIDGDTPTGARAYYRPEDGFTDDSDTPAWLWTTVESDVRDCPTGSGAAWSTYRPTRGRRRYSSTHSRHRRNSSLSAPATISALSLN